MASRRLFAGGLRPPVDVSVYPLLALVAGGSALSVLIGAHHLMHNTEVMPKILNQPDPHTPRFEGPLDPKVHWEFFPQGKELNHKIEERL
jgi:hypothetical protein